MEYSVCRWVRANEQPPPAAGDTVAPFKSMSLMSRVGVCVGKGVGSSVGEGVGVRVGSSVGVNVGIGVGE